MLPRLVALLICRRVDVTSDGSVTLVRVFDGRDFDTLPRHAPFTFFIKLEDVAPPLSLRLELIAEGATIPEFNIDASLLPGEKGPIATLFLPGTLYLTRPTTYTVRLLAGTEVLGSTTLVIGMRSRMN